MRDRILNELNEKGPHSVSELADVLDCDPLMLCEELVDLISESRVLLESDFTLWYAESVDG